MPAITPNLWFDTEAEDAARFYASVFPNSRVGQISHYGPNAGRPEGMVLTVAFELDGTPFTAINGGPQFHFDEAISFEISCGSQDEVDRYWSALTEGGEESQCGWLKDRYGVSWQVIPTRLVELLTDPDPGRSQRAMQAMLQMRKIDIAELERAAAG